MPIELRNLASGEVIEVPNEGNTVGREGGQADLQLKDKGLSSRHARIFADGTDWLIQDLGSTNGTKIADVVVGKEATDIRVGDIITMSDTQLEVMRIWDPKLQQTVVMMAPPIFDTKPTVPAVRRSAPKAEEAPEPAETANATLIGYESQRADPQASNKTMIGYGAPAAVTVEQPAAASEPDMTAKTLIGYSADRVAAAMAAAPVKPPEEPLGTAKTLVGFSADRVAAAMAQAPVSNESSNKTLIGYGAPQPVVAKSKPGPSTVEVADQEDEHTPPEQERPQEEEEVPERPVMHTVRAQAVPRAKAKQAVESEDEEAPQEEEQPQEEAIAPAGNGFDIKYFLVAVPKAIAFYLAAVPLMIVNPIGTIRKGVEQQKHEAKGRMELIAYALPVNLFSAAVGFLSTLIVQIVTGTLSVGGLIFGMLIIPAIVAVVASVVTGFVWHPVVNWVVTKLKGESDERSRTNYFLMFMTATALVVLPNGVGILLSLVPLRLVAMVAPILSALGTVVVLFVTYSWMVKFEVVKWFRTVLLVLGALSLVGGVFGALGRLAAPAGGVGAMNGDVEAQLAAAQKQADEAMKQAAAAGEDAKEQVKEAQDEVKEAQENAKEDVKVAAKGKDVEPGETNAKPAPAPAPVATPTAAEAASVTFPVYVQMRDAVEKKIADDPAVLSKSPELQALYRDYTNTAFEIDARFKAMTEKSPADAKLNGRLRDAEVFAKTEKAVVALHTKLKPAPAPAAKEEKAAPAPAPAAKEEKPKAEAKPAPAAKDEKPKAEAKPAPAAKEEKPKAEAKPAPAAKEEKPKAEAKPAAAAPAGKGKLAASSKPPGAEIWVDGKNTGKKTPLAVSSSLELAAGKHTVLFKMNGKSSAPVEVVIEADKQAVLKGVEIP